MRGYKLTERGKILVALIIVMLLLLTSAILLLRALARSSPNHLPEEDSDASRPPPVSAGDDTSPVTTESTPPLGGDFVPPTGTPPPDSPSIKDPLTVAPSEITPQVDASHDSPYVTPTPDSVTVGEPSVSPLPTPTASESDPTNGVLSFVFSPQTQTALDDVTGSMLKSFLSSSSNTRNNTIVVETPVLSKSDAETLMSVVGSSFSALGVSTLRLMHVPRSYLPPGEVFEVTLYYIPDTGK